MERSVNSENRATWNRGTISQNFQVATGYEKLWFVCRFYFVDRYTQSFEIQLKKFPGNETEQTIILKIWFAEYNIRSPFLGSPGNLTGPKPYFKIKI